MASASDGKEKHVSYRGGDTWNTRPGVPVSRELSSGSRRHRGGTVALVVIRLLCLKVSLGYKEPSATHFSFSSEAIVRASEQGVVKTRSVNNR